MTGFVIVTMLLVGAVLLCLLPPLLRAEPADRSDGHDEANLRVLRDQARELDADLAAGVICGAAHADARRELGARLLEDEAAATPPANAGRQVWTALGLTIGVPLLAAALYAYVGNPAGVGVAPMGMDAGAAQHDAPESIEKMVATLAKRLESTPDDIEGLHMLARSYSALERFDDAARTYARIEKLLPRDAGLLADYADALATAQNASLKGEPERLIARALAIDPRQVKALSLSGSAAFERGDFSLAQQQWRAVLALVPADSAFAQSTQASIAAAGAKLGGAPAAAALSGTVRLAPALRDALPADATVFIYARAVDAPGPPLAVLRKQVRDLPLEFTLDDSMRVGAAKLSAHPRVMVGARISRSGSATAAAGDLEGSAGPVASDARGVVVEINRRRQ